MKLTTGAGDWGFRLFTGAFAVLLLAIVAAIGIELFRESAISIHTFGFKFWITDTWDPVSGEFGARPFIARQFPQHKNIAQDLLVEWMHTFSQRHP